MSAQTILLILLGMAAIALGIVAIFVPIPFASTYYTWIIVGGAALLLIAALFRDRRETHTERVVITR